MSDSLPTSAFIETFGNHQDRFHAIAAICIRAGATCVRLLDKGQIIDSFPSGVIPTDYPVVSVPDYELTIHIYGLSGDFWQSIADTMAELFSSILFNETELESLTAALVETQDRLVALYDLSKSQRNNLEIPVLFEILMNEVCKLLDVPGAFIIMLQPGQSAVIRQFGINQLSDEEILSISSHHHINPQQHKIEEKNLPEGLRNILLVSIPIKKDIFAVLGVFNNNKTDFTSPDIKLAKALAGQAGAQIENALLVQEAMARTRLETEMSLAHQVQTALLPQQLPAVAGIDYYATSSPALEVGGDFFDVVLMPNQPFIFLLGDVTGKGMPAALLMSMTRTVARSAARNMPFTEPHQLMKRLNADLLDDFSAVGMFTTAFIGILDPVSLNLSYCNAGQSPILYVPVDKPPVLLEAQDIPVGIFGAFDYSSYNLSLSSGDIFIVASDGFPEARNSIGEMFGYDRLSELSDSSRHLSAREISDLMFEATNVFSGGLSLEDDRTLVVIKVN